MVARVLFSNGNTVTLELSEKTFNVLIDWFRRLEDGIYNYSNEIYFRKSHITCITLVSPKDDE